MSEPLLVEALAAAEKLRAGVVPQQLGNTIPWVLALADEIHRLSAVAEAAEEVLASAERLPASTRYVIDGELLNDLEEELGIEPPLPLTEVR